MAKMGRPPRNGVAAVTAGLRLTPATVAWLDQEAAELGITRAELLRELLGKGAAAYRAGWKAQLREQLSRTR